MTENMYLCILTGGTNTQPNIQVPTWLFNYRYVIFIKSFDILALPVTH